MHCAVYGCHSNNQSKKYPCPDIKFFRFPKDNELIKIWIHRTGRLDKINIKNACVCSKHFVESDYKRNLRHELLKYTPKRYRGLKDDAVPSQNLPHCYQSSPSTSRKTSEERIKKKERKEIVCGLLSTFPTDSLEKKQWAAFCNIECQNVKANDRLCSLHFKPSKFKFSAAKGKRLTLKPEAVPTILQTPHISQFYSVNVKKYQRAKRDLKSNQGTNTSIGSTIFQTQNLENKTKEESCENEINHSVIIKEESHVEIIEDSENHSENFTDISQETALLDPLHLPIKEERLLQTDDLEDIVLAKGNTHENALNNFECDCPQELPNSAKRKDILSITHTPENGSPTTSPKTKNLKYPRYLNDVTAEHCKGSEAAKMILDVAKRDLDRCRKRTHKLAQQNRRLLKKVATLNETIKQLSKTKTF